MQNNSDNFIMYCMSCGKRYEVGPLEEVTDCKCGGKLDFEPTEKGGQDG